MAIKEQLYAYSLLFGGTDVRVYGYGPSFYGGGAPPTTPSRSSGTTTKPSGPSRTIRPIACAAFPFFYTNAAFTREAWIGVIMMGGIVVNNAILLIDHINQLRRTEGVALREAIVQGTVDRVRPILMTSATTVFGLLPLVFSGESADTNIWNALGLALIGGLSSSTVLVLAVTPAVYFLLERGPERRQVRQRLSGDPSAA